MNWNDPEEAISPGRSRSNVANSPLPEEKKRLPFPFYTLVVHSDLRVSVCCVDWAKETVVGDSRRKRSQRSGEANASGIQLAHLDRRRSEISACRNCTFLHTARQPRRFVRGEFLARINQAAVPQAAE